MFYVASKVFWLFAQPSSLCAMALVAGFLVLALTRLRRLGFSLAFGGLTLLLAGGFLPIGNYLVLPLEQRFANEQLPTAAQPVAGIIILGGFEDGWVSAGREGLAINEAAERLTEGVRLARRWPQAKVVFTGGVGGLIVRGTDAAGPVGKYLEDVGIARDRIKLEPRARNTQENATFAKDLLKPRSGQRWLLVTSAYHMPRSIGVFRAAGFGVIAAPVDYRTRDSRDLVRMFSSIPAGLERFDLGVREWIGLIGYRLTGRTKTLFPGPK
ncbi:MAG: YdcF family protein [Alphaproteobacteria bacterium]|nr:YdcF family protein [Alphaproteobacteria bacterium]